MRYVKRKELERLGAEGRRFKSTRPDHLFSTRYISRFSRQTNLLVSPQVVNIINNGERRPERPVFKRVWRGSTGVRSKIRGTHSYKIIYNRERTAARPKADSGGRESRSAEHRECASNPGVGEN
jgi:hypothetical protein